MDWKRMFYIKGAWYYLVDDSALSRAYEFQAIDGDKPITKLKDGRQAAEQLGAEIIRAAYVDDRRR